jgi:hypothetical protein
MLLVYFLLFVILFTLLIKGGSVLMGHLAGRHIATRHQEAEQIIETGRKPDHWPDIDEAFIRLDELISYFRTSALVADEPTREMILNELNRVRKQWADRVER